MLGVVLCGVFLQVFSFAWKSGDERANAIATAAAATAIATASLKAYHVRQSVRRSLNDQLV